MLEFLTGIGRLTERKARLFACACVRRVWHLLRHDQSRQAVEVTERFVDGAATALELDIASGEAYRRAVAGTFAKPDVTLGVSYNGEVAASNTARNGSHALVGLVASAVVTLVEFTPSPDQPRAGQNERAAQAALLRDIFGNPFRLPALAPSWLTPDVLTLAG